MLGGVSDGAGGGVSSSYNVIAFPSSGRKERKVNGGNLFVVEFEDFLSERVEDGTLDIRSDYYTSQVLLGFDIERFYITYPPH